MLQAHWKEVALHRDTITLDPDYRRYAQAEAGRALVIMTARREEEVVGYSVFFLYHHLHYKECLVASNDVIYLKPECRGLVGARLIERSESELKSLGVHKVIWHIKPKNDWSSVLLRKGYEQEEIIMGKVLGE